MIWLRLSEVTRGVSGRGRGQLPAERLTARAHLYSHVMTPVHAHQTVARYQPLHLGIQDDKHNSFHAQCQQGAPE